MTYFEGGIEKRAQIFDNCGQIEVHSEAGMMNDIVKVQYSSASVILFCFDLTNRDSLDNVCNHWLKMVNEVSPAGTPKMLVGFKRDLRKKNNDKHVTNAEGK